MVIARNSSCFYSSAKEKRDQRFLSIISIISVLNTIRKITARVGKTAAFTDQN
jgi:hypothetical protein